MKKQTTILQIQEIASALEDINKTLDSYRLHGLIQSLNNLVKELNTEQKNDTAITDFAVGDVFESKCGDQRLAVLSTYLSECDESYNGEFEDESEFFYTGFKGSFLKPYGNRIMQKNEVLKELNSKGYRKVGELEVNVNYYNHINEHDGF